MRGGQGGAGTWCVQGTVRRLVPPGPPPPAFPCQARQCRASAGREQSAQVGGVSWFSGSVGGPSWGGIGKTGGRGKRLFRQLGQ